MSSAGVSQAMGHPVGIIMMAGVGLGVSAYLWKAASDQEKLAKENVTKIDEMIAKFNALMAGHCPAGRDDYASLQANPRCYCYSSDGTKNANRTNSETCKSLWESDEKNYFISGSDYKLDKSSKPKMGCMAVNGEYDEKCACKSMKNSKGETACIKVPVQVSLQEPGLSLDAKSFGQTLNGVNSGSLTPADLNHSELEKMATKVNKMNKMLLPDAIKDAKANFGTDLKLGDRFSDSFIRAMSKGDADLALAATGPFALAALNSDRINKALDPSALDLAQSEIGKDGDGGTQMTGGKEAAKAKDKQQSQGLSFDSGQSKVEQFKSDDSEGEKPIGELVKYKDISDSSESLWEILTRKYQQSGIRRLFNEN